jgi:Cu(I)/Ag(I) efflux system membrane fusion protein
MKFRSSLILGICLFMAACSQENNPTEPLTAAMDDTAVEHALKHADASYVCPMHPQIVSDKPGDCPICGMKLVKKTAADPGATASTIGIAPEIMLNMGVRTEAVRRETLWKYIKAVGYVGYNEDRLFHIHARTTGWVERIHAHAQGEKVQAGQPLVEYYSPDLVAAQEELLLSTRGGLLPAAKDRLRLMNVPQSVIDEVLKTGKSKKVLPLLSPIDGVVGTLGIRHGMYITPDIELFSIADLSEVWVKVSVFDHQLTWVKPGRPAEIRVSALPGKKFEGEVDYIYPELDPVTRTLQVRLKFANPDGLLQPNMFADVVIYGGPKEDVLSVSREAVIFSGRQERVIKAFGEGRFQPAIVTIGMQTPDRIEILEGLREGDNVVTSSQFLIDSEAGLQGTFRRMESSAPQQEAGHAH